MKGFLIRLACLCEPCTTKIYTANCRKGKVNISSIASSLNTSREKATILLDKCEKQGLIKAIPRGYIILEDSFLLNIGKRYEDIVYNTIYKYCILKEVVPQIDMNLLIRVLQWNVATFGCLRTPLQGNGVYIYRKPKGVKKHLCCLMNLSEIFYCQQDSLPFQKNRIGNISRKR